MANPRKFSEKIALHNHRQAEETARFEQIMKEVSAATSKVGTITFGRILDDANDDVNNTIYQRDLQFKVLCVRIDGRNCCCNNNVCKKCRSSQPREIERRVNMCVDFCNWCPDDDVYNNQ